MAGDGLATNADRVVATDHVKIARLADGRVVGCCGCSKDRPLFVEWLANGGTKPKLDKGFHAMVMSAEQVSTYYHDLSFDVEETPIAIGTGRDFALAAMDIGASPEDAVRASIRRDIYTGGKITVLHLESAVRAVA